MKFPKLKHSALCQILLYFPMFSIFWLLLVYALLSEKYGISNILLIIVLLVAGVLSLWYLLSHFALFLASDVLFAYIRSWKRARLVYRSFRNGRSRESVEKRVLRRCRIWGRAYASGEANAARRGGGCAPPDRSLSALRRLSIP